MPQSRAPPLTNNGCLRKSSVDCASAAHTEPNLTKNQLTIQRVNEKIRPATRDRRFLTARQLPSGDVIFVADSPQTKTQAAACRSSWEHILGSNASLAAKKYTVLVHRIKTSLFPNDQQNTNVMSLHNQNPNAKDHGKIVKTAWRQRTLRRNKRFRSLLLDVSTPELANLLINRGPIIGDEIHEVELFDSRCLPTRCYKCQGYNITAPNCRKEGGPALFAQQPPTTTPNARSPTSQTHTAAPTAKAATPQAAGVARPTNKRFAGSKPLEHNVPSCLRLLRAVQDAWLRYPALASAQRRQRPQ